MDGPGCVSLGLRVDSGLPEALPSRPASGVRLQHVVWENTAGQASCVSHQGLSTSPLVPVWPRERGPTTGLARVERCSLGRDQIPQQLQSPGKVL